MLRVLIYSGLLIAGMALAVTVDLEAIRYPLTTLTMICLAYIMMEVGLEFTIDKLNLWSYGKDYLIAMTAALIPWICCALYFLFVIKTPALEAFVIGRFAAPTSAGVLFAMLAAAGLGTTWLFKKARILAIFGDIGTILLMIPLRFALIGVSWSLIVTVPIIIVLLWTAYRFLHRIRFSTRSWMLLLYGALLVFILEGLEHTVNVELELLFSAFVWGCMLYNPHDPYRPKAHQHEHAYIEPEGRFEWCIDCLVKGSFMFLVGASLPPMEFNATALWIIGLHVIALTIISNIGKSFPSLCYRKEASLRERLALSVAMYPRGEVGAAVLLIVFDLGIRDQAIGLAVASLALNLLLTGVFIWIVLRLIRPQPS